MFFLILAIFSGFVMLAGVVSILVTRGRTTHRSGPDVGAEIMTDQEIGGGSQLGAGYSKTVFHGKASMVRREVEVSMGEIKAGMKAGQWGRVLPAIMALTGFVALLFFGGLAALFLGAILFGAVLLLFSFGAAIRLFIDLIRA